MSDFSPDEDLRNLFNNFEDEDFPFLDFPDSLWKVLLEKCAANEDLRNIFVKDGDDVFLGGFC